MAMKKPLHACHRGGTHEFGPENTLFNYERCVKELNTHILEVSFSFLHNLLLLT